jgi:polysaccharide deacetylase family sporulation protein PdaB
MIIDSAIYNVHTKEKIIALTFDIVWWTKVPKPVLDILEKKRVPNATFFLAGPWASRNVKTAKRIRSMGYEIGSHGFRHYNYSKYGNNWIEKEVKKAESAIFRAAGVRTRLIRTPNGDHNRRVIKKLHQMGYQVIQWDTDSLDWMNPGVHQIVSRVLTRVHPGDIILMHASDTCKQTVASLPLIIDGLRRKGYRFVKIPTMIRMIER